MKNRNKLLLAIGMLMLIVGMTLIFLGGYTVGWSLGYLDGYDDGSGTCDVQAIYKCYEHFDSIVDNATAQFKEQCLTQYLLEGDNKT